MKVIEGYPRYKIGEDGTVVSYVRRTPKVLKWLNKRYPSVTLCNAEGPKEFRVHRLVADAYIPNPLKLPCVLHKDDDTSNPHKDNLIRGTQKDNVHDCINKNRRVNVKLGANGQARPCIVETQTGLGHFYTSLKQLCLEYKFNYRSVKDTLRIKNEYKGYKVYWMKKKLNNSSYLCFMQG